MAPKKGNIPWNKGLTKETDIRVLKYAINRKGKHKHYGSKNSNWRGDKAGMGAMHDWIKKIKPKPLLCEKCRTDAKLELSSKTHEYKRNINEYRWLCRSCHELYDIEVGVR